MNRLILPAALALAATPALAHHPLSGASPQTVWHGVLSGLAHPVIGLDHLAFVVLAGIAAALAGRGLIGAAVFVAATIAGTFVQLADVVLPVPDLAVALSVVVLGALLVLGRRLTGLTSLAGFAVAGLFHGWAYGDAVVGSGTMPVLAYLAGFATVQLAIAFGAARLTAWAMDRPEGAWQARLAAAVCAGVGFTFAFEQLEGMILG